VLRGGEWQQVMAYASAGDIIRLYLGDVVPDCSHARHYISIDQSALTGSRLPVTRNRVKTQTRLRRTGRMVAVITATARIRFWADSKISRRRRKCSHFQRAVMRSALPYYSGLVLVVILVASRVFDMRATTSGDLFKAG